MSNAVNFKAFVGLKYGPRSDAGELLQCMLYLESKLLLEQLSE
jgi:hypothetical protein